MCLYQEGMPYCYYPPCLKSGMSKVYKADKGECPRNSITYQECVQKITDSNISAKEINLRCNMSSEGGGGGGKGGGGSSGGSGGGGSGGSGGGGSTPIVGNDGGGGGASTFSKYKGWIIGGSVGLGVLILLIIGIVIYKSRSKSSGATSTPTASVTNDATGTSPST